MTCIVGIAHEGKVWMGGDAAGVQGTFITTRGDPKVFTRGEYIFGFSGSIRMGQVIQHSFRPPDLIGDMEIDRFVADKFINKLRDCLRRHGIMETKTGVDSSLGTFLMGYRGRLFRVETDFQTGWSVDSHDSIGSGSDIALGVLFATPKMEPWSRIMIALQAATHYYGSVRPPFLIESV